MNELVNISIEDLEDRMKTLEIVRNVVDKYKGNLTVDFETNTLEIDGISKENEMACAQEIEDRISMFYARRVNF